MGRILVVLLAGLIGCGAAGGRGAPDASVDSSRPLEASADVESGQDASTDASADSSFADGPTESSAKTCTPATCVQRMIDCGYAADGCGGLLHCGNCFGSQVCGGAGFDVCGGTGPLLPDGSTLCVPRTCMDQGIHCGPAGDGCGGTIQCGSCTAPQECGAGVGAWFNCNDPDTGVCMPLDCAEQNRNCGPAGDGCGHLLDCGTCDPPYVCGGGGFGYQCGTANGVSCNPEGCIDQGIECGPAGDGCGGVIQCGSCAPPKTCGGGGYGKCG